jgi:hypothetical protein
MYPEDKQRLEQITRRAENVSLGPWETVNHQRSCASPCTPDGCPEHDTGVAYSVSGPHLLVDGEPVSDVIINLEDSVAVIQKKERRLARQMSESYTQADRDSRFIAHARDDIPWLLSLIAGLDRDCTVLREHIRVADEAYNQLHKIWKALEEERTAALTMLGYGDDQLLRGVERMHEYHKQELNYARGGVERLKAYALELQKHADPAKVQELALKALLNQPIESDN